MKYLVIILSIFSLEGFSQTKGELVNFRTDRRAFFFAQEFFEANKEQIVKQIGEEEFNEVVKFSSMPSWPKEMQYDLKQKDDSTWRRNYYKRLSKLNVYKICTFENAVSSEKEKQVILRVPYSENKDWDPASKWDIVYFVIEKQHVKP